MHEAIARCRLVNPDSDGGSAGRGGALDVRMRLYVQQRYVYHDAYLGGRQCSNAYLAGDREHNAVKIVSPLLTRSRLKGAFHQKEKRTVEAPDQRRSAASVRRLRFLYR